MTQSGKNEARAGVVDTAPGLVWSQKLRKSQFSRESCFFLLGSLGSSARSGTGSVGSRGGSGGSGVAGSGSGITRGSGSVGRSGASGVGSARSGIAGSGSGITRGSGGIGRGSGSGVSSSLRSGSFLLGAGGQHERRENGAESELRLHLVVPQEI
jgi:hypothetical protein